VPDIAPRRRILLASAATLPLLLATAGCRSSDAFTGPDPLAGRPRPAPDVVTLAAVIAAEENLIGLYRTALARDSAATAHARDLLALLAQHEQHLTRLRARLIQPPGTAAAAASPRPSAKASAAAPERVTIAGLRAAERASAVGLVRRLATVEPALAQLFASIAASDATHVTALGG
jgi:hypothetical protein